MYHGLTDAGFSPITFAGLRARFKSSKQINPTVKLSKDPIKGPPVCRPNLVFNIACTGITAPTISVRNINTNFMSRSLSDR